MNPLHTRSIPMFLLILLLLYDQQHTHMKLNKSISFRLKYLPCSMKKKSTLSFFVPFLLRLACCFRASKKSKKRYCDACEESKSFYKDLQILFPYVTVLHLPESHPEFLSKSMNPFLCTVYYTPCVCVLNSRFQPFLDHKF